MLVNFYLILFAEFLLVTNSFGDEEVTEAVSIATEGQVLADWGGTCARGTLQSPIRLRRSEATESTNKPFEFDNLEAKQSHLELHNNGYGLELLIPFVYKILIYGGNLGDDKYVLYRVQWHWDRSEHDLDDRTSRLETHLVFFNTRYSSWDEALSRSDGVVILAVLHQMESGSTNYISKIRQVIGQVTDPKSKATVLQDMSIRELLPYDLGTYYSYKGSLTSPPCAEVVKWIVFTDYMQVTNDDIGSFRTVKGSKGGPIYQNYRSLQSPNGRNIVFNSFVQSNPRSMSPKKIGTSYGLLSVAAAVAHHQH